MWGGRAGLSAKHWRSHSKQWHRSGLCHLLHIGSAEKLPRHAMCGALFENMIFSELLKSRYHHGQRRNLYCWRDRSGHEVDVILSRGVEIWPIEIKSGQTITLQWVKGLIQWQRISGQAGGWICYGGEERQQRYGQKLARGSRGSIGEPWSAGQPMTAGP